VVSREGVTLTEGRAPEPCHDLELFFEHAEPLGREGDAVCAMLPLEPAGAEAQLDATTRHLVDLRDLPKPVQHPLPVIVGGGGPSRTPRIAARFAAEFNAPFPEFDAIPGLFAGVREACEQIGRDPHELVYSAALVAATGQTEAEFSRRAAAIGREPEELRQHGLAGSPAELVDRIGALREDGVQRLYLQILDIHDLDHLELIAAEVASELD
jgi:alkanesulfonate monooxygenase SsuD/methylene tetrahydromethanopterin reductase-like flavin-dependent oxidoreductase (luciferase family)